MASTTVPELTVEYVRECLDYDPATGVLMWRLRPLHHFKTKGARNAWNARFAKTPAGCTNSSGYRIIQIKGKGYSAARLAWILAKGELPKAQTLDHIDHDRENNRLLNLREVSFAENARNKSLRSNNTSGTHGVYWDSRRARWHATIKVNGKRLHYGYFESLDDAVAARRAAEKEHGFHTNHGR